MSKAERKHQPRVLVVDDSRFSQVTTKDILAKHGFKVHVVGSGEDALQYVQELGLVEVILSDMIMPGMDGRELCSKFRELYPNDPLGLLLITSSGEKELKQKALAAGADDFLAKPFIPEELVLRTTLLSDLVSTRRHMGVLKTKFDEAQKRVEHLEAQMTATQQRLKLATSRDDLTGLMARQAFFTMLEREFKRARRYKTQLCLMTLEVDHLTTISEGYGFHALDIVFTNLGNLVRDSIRDVDMAGRFGMQSVAILLPETPLSNAHVVAQRMVDRAKENSFMVEENSLSITFCVGVVDVQEDKNHDAFLRRAQQALSEAKGIGPGTVKTG